MENIIEINDSCYLDATSHMLAVQIDRVTFTFHVDEFLDFYEVFDDIKDFLITSPDYVVGRTMTNDENKDVIVPKPDENEYT